VKKYGKFVSIVLFAILGAFVLLQYQNCGNSSSNTNTTPVGPAGIAYTITLTPTPGTITHGSRSTLQLRVQSSGIENIVAVIGQLVNGVTKSQLCTVQPNSPSVDWTLPTCSPTFNQAGNISLYVDLYDPNYPPSEYMADCSQMNGLPVGPGCQGTFNLLVQ